jgi:capsular polysaccharide biosynthesis protein
MRFIPSGRRALPSIVAGVVVAALVVATGVYFVSGRPTVWESRGSVLVLPASRLETNQVPGYYETLSRGQVVESYAEIVRLQRFADATAEELGVPPAELSEVRADVSVPTGTALIQVRVTAPSAEVSERMTAGIVTAAAGYINDLAQPYDATVASDGVGTAQQRSPATKVLFGIVALAAVALGVIVQQVWWILQQALGQSGAHTKVGAPAAAGASS